MAQPAAGENLGECGTLETERSGVLTVTPTMETKSSLKYLLNRVLYVAQITTLTGEIDRKPR